MSIVHAIRQRLGNQQLNYHLNVCPAFRLVYFEVSKAGCSSVKSFLSDHLLQLSGETPDVIAEVVRWPHRHILSSPFVKPYQLGDAALDEILASSEYRRFTVVRNPVNRLLSAYRDKILRREKVNKLHRAMTPEEIVHYGSVDMSFAEFVRLIEKTRNPARMDQHWRPQWFHTCAGIIDYEEIVRLENLGEGMRRVLADTGLEWDDRRVAPHGTSSRDGDEIDPETLGRLSVIYRDDFQRFNYKIPQQSAFGSEAR